MKNIKEMTNFIPFRNEDTFFYWKFESVSENDINFLIRKGKVFNFKLDEYYSKYKCINERLGISMYLISITYKYIEDEYTSIWHFILKYDDRDNWEETHLITLYHKMNGCENISKDEIFPNVFLGDRLIFDSICHFDINTSGRSVYSIYDVSNKKVSNEYNIFVSGVLFMGYFIGTQKEEKELGDNYIGDIKSYYLF